MSFLYYLKWKERMQTLIFIVFIIGHSQSDESQPLDGNVNNFAVVNGAVYVATDDKLYQMDRNLTVEIRKDTAQPNRVQMLVPFGKNNTLITCGTYDCGYCDVLDLKNISKTVHTEQIAVASVHPNESSFAFLVDIGERTNNTYLLSGAVPQLRNCVADIFFITLRNTNDSQDRGIFSASEDEYGTPQIRSRSAQWVDLDFVDGFPWKNHFYILINFNIRSPQSRVRLLTIKRGNKKRDTLQSFRGTTLQCCGSKYYTRLASSAVVGGSPLLWAGIFKVGNSLDPESTALAIFNITPRDSPGREDPDFRAEPSSSTNKEESETKESETVAPLAVYKYRSMTSVATVTASSWLVFFIGTADGQLIKISMDKAMKPTCPIVLYKSGDDRPVHSKMILDPVDKKHIYLALGNQMKRVAVAQCWRYSSMRDCWFSHDPFCGWCSSQSRCTFHDECLTSTWISIPDGSLQERMISFCAEETPSREKVILNVTAHLKVVATGSPAFSCAFTTERGESLCAGSGDTAAFPSCSCVFLRDKFPAGLGVTVKITIDNQIVSESWNLKNCSLIQGGPTSALCSECVAAGCLWSFTQHTCSWMPWSSHESYTQGTCQNYSSGLNISKPEIYSITPSEISFYGKNNATITGKNLDHVTKLHIRGDMGCNQMEVPFHSRSSDRLTLHVPGGSKGRMTVCVELPDGTCYGSAEITYRSLPSCTGLSPDSSWASGGRAVSVLGTNLQFVDEIEHLDPPQTLGVHFSSSNLQYYTPSVGTGTRRNVTVRLKVANETIACATLTYHPDPEFIRFTTSPSGDDLRITVEKKVDKLNISREELNIYALEGDVEHKCQLDKIEPSHSSGMDSIDCEIHNKANAKIESVKIYLGNHQFEVKEPQKTLYLIVLVICIIVLIFPAVGCTAWIYRSKQRKLSERMNEYVELLECDIRKEIRQGFVDMQTQKMDLTENVGVIPFLDYKHFASRIFFPDVTMSGFLKDLDQASENAQMDRRCEALSALIRNRLFLTSFVHALEEQKHFSINDKCHVASLLTLALHSDLPYLTEVMEVLLRALMDQYSNTQPKLMLRSTKSIVEKLLTNWMSICLYGFLRESVGQPLFLLVSALNQQISRGPVDSVTEKALYTLNEDWLLWQAQDFSALKLNVSFDVVSVGEGSSPLEVSVLDCDTVEQAKEKILGAFKSKFGFPYSGQLPDIDIAYEKGGQSVLLQEVDQSSEVMGSVTMLNTLRHYQIPDGASVKVITKQAHAPLSTQVSLKDDRNYSIKYFHLIDPDIDCAQGGNPERKKLKLKEIYLTKLLSTKVAVHSYVEKLFRTIWGTANSRVPPAVKYFFDFLDAQGESKKISDPDVLHIWKTNSLPLRFWVNILKNPQFVFDMEKTPLLDSCLSVIAQAFMDSFSLAEQQLDKHSPTNKLLYAKDIPQYKLEVKAYYKQVGDLPGFSSEDFKAFLQEESEKHENEFNETAALQEIYKYLHQNFNAVEEKLVQNGASSELKEKLQQVKDLFTNDKSCSWD
ncbi:plexin-C1 isoform X2 [Anguilla anguilla]|uniref:plexin-C1 isoform X2 n=1 Tax=Anguilla anguilla TaxID=7936 RepID=UPI0015ACD96B|nr:plexin-C1 isoform X2 [Anguilla anguilla]